MEQQILAAAFVDREVFNRLEIVGAEKQLSDVSTIIYKELQEYYKRDSEAYYVDKEIIISSLTRKHPKHGDTFTQLVKALPTEVSVNNVTEEIAALTRQNIEMRLSGAFASGNRKLINDLLDEYTQLETCVLEKGRGSVYIAPSIEGLLQRTARENRIAIYPKRLTDVLEGGMLRKHHAVIFARPEKGKTIFALNAAYGFLKQGLKTLYVSNEDAPDDIMERFLWRLTGLGKYGVRNDLRKAEEIALSRNYDKFILAELTPGTPYEIESLINEFEPDCLIVDQTRNLLVKENNRVVQLEQAAQAIRTLGKKYNLVSLSFFQAGDSAEGKRILNMGDLDFNNTGVQSTADLMIGIGADYDMEVSGFRMLSFPKNKISGSKVPTQVRIDPLNTKVE